MAIIGFLIMIAQLGTPVFLAYQGLILGAVFLGLGIVVVSIGFLVGRGEQKSIYFCGHCKFAASTKADLYNHSVKEHKDESEVLRQRLVKGFGFYECTSCRFEALTVSEIKKHCDDKGHADYIFKSKNS